MYRVHMPIWMVHCQSCWERFHWQRIKCQTLHHTRMHHNKLQLQFKIHLWHQHSQSHQLAQQEAPMEPDGIYIHQFVSWIHQFIYFIICSSNPECIFTFIHYFAAAPIFTESGYRGNIIDKNESQYMRNAGGQNDFAPRYPVYTAQTLPPLPNTQT